jgi:transcriptional regulator with XRE-family HTH domain
MASDQGPVVQSALLRSELVRLRKERGLTQEQVASKLEWSASKLIRVEGGRGSITKVDLDALLGQYGLTSESQRERLQNLNRGARAVGWWNAYRTDISPASLDYVGYEAGATFIRQFQNTVVPDLLQTPDYSRALTVISGEERGKVDSVVGLRLRRQSELARCEAPPHQYYVLDEAVIRRHIGVPEDPAIMPGQLMHIVSRARDDERITVRVIPFEKGSHAGLSGSFTLLEFDGGLPDILYLDTDRKPINSDDRVAEYADSFESLVETALSVENSLEFIRNAAEEIGPQALAK